MKKFFGIILIIFSSICLLMSILMLVDGGDVAVVGMIFLMFPGIIVFITGVRLCRRPKVQHQPYLGDRYYPPHSDHDEFDDKNEEYFKKSDYEELQEPVAVNCSGCGAKAKVYPNLSTNCEYCGTTIRIS
ncbi:hypothetical protein JNUCC31_02050 [Paenibacillus sp. JNUCC31]|uniref:hypothetical protein n=1 Tax=unclassified Paenibacillus TaxID=185978 RepID=UPI00177C986E|nr:hypothetical protein [Paenibacillus sp. JNUCC-31]QOS79758.1 hypothetical protein JNUCC31_02050 [Paenibacillus sp. JNUCC-31]